MSHCFTMKKYIALISAVMSVFAAEASYSDTLSLQGPRGELYAILESHDRPGPGDRYPLVIICHGFGSSSHDGLVAAVADDVVSRGMAALRFDFNGHGRSAGAFQDMTVPSEIDDLRSVVSWAREQPWVSSVSLVGHSQGGVVVGMAAGELGDGIIKSEVLLAPAAVLRDDALRGNTMGAIYDPWNFRRDYVELPFGSLRLGREYIRTAIGLPIYETSAQYTGPALVVHGTHDRVVPYTYAERYHDKVGNSELRLMTGDDHVFSATTTETAALVADWLAAQLK